MSQEVASIHAKIGLEASELSRGLQQAQRQIQGANGVIEASLGKLSGIATKLAGPVALGAVVAKLGSFAAEATQLAARNEMLATSLRVVGGNAGWASEQLDKAVAGVKAMGITTAVSTTSVTRYIQAQLGAGKSAAEASDEVANLARVAQDLAVVAGTNSSEALETLMAAASSLRPVLLRQFGITDGLVSIYDTYAKTLGKTGDQLTVTEQKAAFLARIQEEGTRVAGAYESAMGDVAKQMGSMQRYVEEAKVAVGEHFLPVMRESVSVQKEFWSILKDVAPLIGEAVAPAVEGLARALAGIAPVLKEAVIFLTQGADALREYHEATREGIAGASASYDEYVNTILATGEAMTLMGTGMSRNAVIRELEKRGVLESRSAYEELVLSLEMADLKQANLAARTQEVAQVTIQATETIAEAWAKAFPEDELKKAVDSLAEVAANAQSGMLNAQRQWQEASANAAFDYSSRRQIDLAKHNAAMAQLQAAGDTEGMAKLQARYAESQTMGEWNFKVQEQLRERDKLQAIVAEKLKAHGALQEQYAYVKKAIETSVIKAKAEGGIVTKSMMVMLNTVKSSLTESLIQEALYAQNSSGVFQGWSQNVVNYAGAAAGGIGAYFLALEGDLAGSSAALAQAQADLANFQLNLPALELPPIEMGDGGGGVGGIAESAQGVVSNLAQSMSDGIKAGMEAIKDLLDFELPEGWEAGLDKFKTAAVTLATKFAEIWQESKAELKRAAKAAPHINDIAGAFSAMLAVIKSLGEDAPASASVIDANMQIYVAQMRAAIGRLMDWLTSISKDSRKLLEDAAPVSANIQKLFGLLGVDLAKSVPVETGQFDQQITQYVAQMEVAGRRLMDWLRKIKPEWQELVKEAAGVSENIRKIFNLLGIDLAKSIPVKDGAAFNSQITEYVSQLEIAGMRLMDWMRKIKPAWQKMLADAAPVAENIVKVFGILSIDLSKVKGFAPISEQSIIWIVEAAESLLTKFVALANKLKDKIDERTAEVLGIMSTAGGGIKSMIDALLTLGGIKKYKKIFTDAGTKTSAIWETMKEDMQFLMDDLAAWDLKVNIENLTAVVEKLTSVRDIIGMMAGIVGDIRGMAEGGGLNVNAARVIFAQFSALFGELPGYGWSGPPSSAQSGGGGAQSAQGAIGGGLPTLMIHLITDIDEQVYSVSLEQARQTAQHLYINAAHRLAVV